MLRIFCAIFLVAFTSVNANAALITGLYNTGVSETDAVLANGATDSHYLVDGDSSIVISDNFYPIVSGPWLASSSDSKWIWLNDPMGQSSNYITNTTAFFTLTFDLTGYNPGSVEISGRFAVDNALRGINLNGSSTGVSGSGFRDWTNYAITSGFQEGLNTLTFEVYNSGGPGGFRNEFVGLEATRVSEPAVLGLFGLTLLAMRRFKRS